MVRWLLILFIVLPLSFSNSLWGAGSKSEKKTDSQKVSKQKKRQPRKATQDKKSSKQKIPALLQKVEKRYAEASTITADFDQLTKVASMKTEKKSKGKIWVKRPNMVRWETKSPEENLLVGNGKQYWFYTPPFDEEEPGQVVIKKKSAVQSRLADALLAGSFSLAKDMKFTKKGKSDFLLVPQKKGAAGDVKKAQISVNSKKSVIERVTLTHYSGNVSEIKLSNIKLGKTLKDDFFNFKIPKGAEVIQH